MTRKILAFYSPYPGAGKSTAAVRVFWNSQPKKRFAFADPLYDISAGISAYCLANKYGIYIRGYKDKSLPELGGASIRDFLIGFGNKGREIYPNLWSEYMRGKLHRFSYGSVNIVIDDLRFPNEYAMLREEGAKIVRITNPGREIVPSETEALLEGYEFDAELVNDKQDLATYEAKLDKLLAELWPDKILIKQ